MKLIDKYILKKFFGTFILSIVLIQLIVIVFDISEKVGDFIDKKAPLSAILFDYYLNFIPYFANLFSPLFCFISVIYFTSRMAYKTEFVAILSAGVSFNRILIPYILGSLIISLCSLGLNYYVIPKSQMETFKFQMKYVWDTKWVNDIDIHRQIEPGTFIYMNSYNSLADVGYLFSMEKIENGQRNFYLNSNLAKWDSTTGKWSIENYFIREIKDGREYIRSGNVLDTAINLTPLEFERRSESIETMTQPELNEFIASEKMKGIENVEIYEVEKYKRTAFPFATVILTLMGVAIASRKVRGGIGLHLGLGIGLSFTYIMFMQIATTLSIKAGVTASFAVWIPNALFLFIALILIRSAQK